MQHAVSVRNFASEDITYGRIRANICHVEAFAWVLMLDLWASDGEANTGHDGKVGGGVITGGRVVGLDGDAVEN